MVYSLLWVMQDLYHQPYHITTNYYPKSKSQSIGCYVPRPWYTLHTALRQFAGLWYFANLKATCDDKQALE